MAIRYTQIKLSTVYLQVYRKTFLLVSSTKLFLSAHLFCLRHSCPPPVSIKLLLRCAKWVEPVNMDILTLWEPENTANCLLLEGLGLSKGHNTNPGHICRTIWVDYYHMVGHFQIGPYRETINNSKMSAIWGLVLYIGTVYAHYYRPGMHGLNRTTHLRPETLKTAASHEGWAWCGNSQFAHIVDSEVHRERSVESALA